MSGSRSLEGSGTAGFSRSLMAGRSCGGAGRTWGAFEQSGTASEAHGAFLPVARSGLNGRMI
eukprot:3355242-Prymnesium_polylepis.1